jgi:hypothetical protein
MSRTGYALGNLRPTIYFENASGHLVLAPEEIGMGTALARRIYEQRYSSHGYQWKETRTLNDVDILQKRLVEQEARIYAARGLSEEMSRERLWSETGDRMRARMTSAACTPYERDFIEIYLKMREEKRKVYQQRWTEYHDYLWAREMDSSTKIEDRMKGDLSL